MKQTQVVVPKEESNYVKKKGAQMYRWVPQKMGKNQQHWSNHPISDSIKLTQRTSSDDN